MPSAPVGVFVGLATLDVIHLVEQSPGPNEKVTARRQFLAAGGPAANAAVTFAALGGQAVLVTALGRGSVADLIRSDLSAFGVQVVDARPDLADGAPVSSIAVGAATGERSIISVDATAISGPETVDAALLSDIDRAAVLLLDGHHPWLGLAAARRASTAGIPVVVDAGRWKPVFDDLIPLDPEFLCSADLRSPGTVDLVSSAIALRERGVGTVVTTRGAEPVLWWQGDDCGAVDVPVTRAVDTLGAGDAFHGAYAHARTSGSGLTDRIAGAAAVAAARVSVLGPRHWLSLITPDPAE